MITFATIANTDDIMRFMHEEWSANHILSVNRELFLHEFRDGDGLNLAIARNKQGRLTGLFGFIRYNNRDLPDLAGSLWKVAETEKEPMLGLRLREFVIKNIPHRFFAAPGAGLQTKPIYQVLRMNWNRMIQYYLLNNTLNSYKLAVVPDVLHQTVPLSATYEDLTLEPVFNPEELRSFDFESFTHIVPCKDFDYIKKRFFNYPIYSYDVFVLRKKGAIENIIICREDCHQKSTAWRIVDFYGNESKFPQIATFLYSIMIERKYEYIDFISHGFDHGKMISAGFLAVDFESNNLVIPNYFGPFVQKNVPIYCVSDKTDWHFRQCKADGDQDRPSMNPIRKPALMQNAHF